MKTLAQVIDEVKDGGKPDYEDLRYTVVALSALHHFAFSSIQKLAQREREGKYKPELFGLDWESRERFKQFQTALSLPPKEYVGPSHDPDTAECQEWRSFSKRILAKVQADQAQTPQFRCDRCKGEMVHNVPRMGPAGGYVHKSTGTVECP